jgi:hypothetical protein
MGTYEGAKAMKTGDIVMVIGKLRRGYKEGTEQGYGYNYWEPYVMPERKAMFLGYRTLYNGQLVHDEDSCSIVFCRKEHFRAALVILLDGRTNPFYCRLEDVTLEEPKP